MAEELTMRERNGAGSSCPLCYPKMLEDLTSAWENPLVRIAKRWGVAMTDVTRILNAIERGDAKATDELLPLVYEELRLLAAQRLSHEPPGQTIQATALVHEAYIRLIGLENQSWRSKGHFFIAAAEAMRRILIDRARHKKSLKRGGDRQRVPLDEAIGSPDSQKSSDDLIDLDEALAKLSKRDQTKADLVKLRYFGY